jgi:hypothetical protein
MLIDDACAEYAELASVAPNAADHAYYRFVTLRWDGLDVGQLPPQHRDLMRTPADKRHAVPGKTDEPLARLLEASLLVMRQEATASTLEVAVETASERGWRQPLLTYLKLQQEQAVARGNLPDQARLERRIRLVEERLLPPPK